MSDNSVNISGFTRDRDEALKVSVSRNNELPDVLNVTLVGRIDNYNAAFFQNKMEMIYEEGFRKIMFMCESLDFVSSAGFGVFTSFFSKVQEDNGTFVFRDIKPKVMEVFHLLGFDHLFGIAFEDYDIERLFTEGCQQKESVFPKSFACPVCNSKLRTVKAGKFRCSKCRVVIEINEDGDVKLV